MLKAWIRRICSVGCYNMWLFSKSETPWLQGCLSAHLSLLSTNADYLDARYHRWALLRDSQRFYSVVLELVNVDRCGYFLHVKILRCRCFNVMLVVHILML